ncbi:MAG: hypothetical protein AAFU85_08650 [Planctomycetota bacterium]
MKDSITSRILFFIVVCIGSFGIIHAETVTSLDGTLIPDDSSEKSLQIAIDALKRGQVADCRRLTAKLTSNSDRLPHADVLVATWLFKSHELDAATKLMEYAAKTNPPRPDIHALFAEVAFSQGRSFDAWTHLLAAEAATSPENWSPEYSQQWRTNIRVSKGVVAAARGDWKTTHRLLKAFREHESVDVNVLLTLSQAAFHLGNMEQAETDLRRAATLQPGVCIPELMLAQWFASINRSDEVERWFAKGGRETYEHSDQIRLAHIRWLITQNRIDDAADVIKSARKNPSTRTDMHFLSAIVDLSRGDYDSAEARLAKLHQQLPENVVISNQLALALVESQDEGKRSRALQIATANAKAAPESVDLVASLAWIQFRLGDIASASAISDAILHQGGTLNRDSCFFIATIQEKRGRQRQAKALFDASRDSAGKFLNAYRTDPPNE